VAIFRLNLCTFRCLLFCVKGKGVQNLQMFATEGSLVIHNLFLFLLIVCKKEREQWMLLVSPHDICGTLFKKKVKNNFILKSFA